MLLRLTHPAHPTHPAYPPAHLAHPAHPLPHPLGGKGSRFHAMPIDTIEPFSQRIRKLVYGRADGMPNSLESMVNGPGVQVHDVLAPESNNANSCLRKSKDPEASLSRLYYVGEKLPTSITRKDARKTKKSYENVQKN
ncbi:hypothetical protein O988_06922 [Pseudogymnoascus sp. VKM F-3808]|nr:hypothetical protein O988_06922 [Pseudogymnoascus sp. VKM F-3808]